MFNPFSVFNPQYLPEFRKKGVKAFVMQQFDRGRNLLAANPGPAYLLSHFDDIGLAHQHYDAVKHHANRRLFIIDDPQQYDELQHRLSSKDALYYTRLLIKDANFTAQKVLDKKNRAYIDYQSGWRPSRYDEVAFSLDVIFGEIYVRFKYKGREIKIKLEELEKIDTNVIAERENSLAAEKVWDDTVRNLAKNPSEENVKDFIKLQGITSSNKPDE